MPPYAFLSRRDLKVRHIARHMLANKAVGVPYTPEMIKNAIADMRVQAEPDGDTTAFLKRYPKAAVGDLAGDGARLTEMDALVAYLQILGRMVDFKQVKPSDLKQ